MARGWAEGDATLFGEAFASDCDFTTVGGDRPAGRAGIVQRHEELFRTAYRSTVLQVRIDSISHPTPDLAVVHAASTIATADGGKLADTDALALVRRDAHEGRWRIVAFHNMVPVSRPAEQPSRRTAGNQEKHASSLLRHLAIVVSDPGSLAAFYQDVFGMEVFHKDPDGSRFLSDGYFTLALIQHRLDGETPLGMNHFGFHIGDTEAVTALLTSRGVQKPAERSTGRPFAEYRAMDPEGNWFDLSEHGFGGPGSS
ncbi:hypothetical protein Sm713_50330 [Streptomyces sp. TS71-3]|nr:hypothetical protein Sm713_50330 [Streptomyces sp. TS71-3]